MIKIPEQLTPALSKVALTPMKEKLILDLGRVTVNLDSLEKLQER